MSFLEIVEQVRAFLERNERMSLRALEREFGLAEDALGELVEELVDVQRVAVLDGRVLVWSGASTRSAPPQRAPTAGDSVSPTPDAIEADAEARPTPTLEGERKQATVFFADVKGSTALTEQAGAERWAGVLDGYVRLLEAGIRRFDGTVAQYTGDGIMALFGAPIAHEDHAQRACLAALWLRDALKDYAEQVRAQHGLDLRVRIGINSGEIVMGKIGDDLGVDFTAQGHTVHVAQRMEQLADDGVPCLAPATVALVEGYFELEDRGEFDIKGASKPLHVHALVGVGRAKTRLEAGRSRGLSRFVGRVHEMETLDWALAQAREGRGQVVGVVGEAGVGKSRLCAEFLERASVAGAAVHQGHCLVHAKTVSYLPILELLGSMLGVDETEDEAEQRRIIADELRDLAPSFVETIPLVLDFLAVSDPARPAPSMAPEARQRQVYDFVRRLVQAMSVREPLVLFVDDVHWIDPNSDAFLAQIVSAVADTRTLLLVNFRPEYAAEWMGRSGYQQLSLQPLVTRETEALLDELIGTDPSVADIPELIRERTGGNPFFVEEVVRSLAESGSLEGHYGEYRLVAPIDTLEVPTTVQPVLAARIDRLAEREKQTLQAASVIGREFTVPVISAVLDWPALDLSESLRALEDGEFIHVRSLYPVTEYAFKHPLTQEVALGSQLRGRRERTHAAVATAIESAFPDRLDEQAALIAHHCEGAGARLEAARWHQRAGALDMSKGALTPDITHLERAYQLAKSEPETSETLNIMLDACTRLVLVAPICGVEMDERDRLAAEGRALAQRLGNRFGLYLIEYATATARILSGWSGESPIPAARRAIAIAEHLDLTAQADAQFAAGNSLFHMGRVTSGRQATEAALALTAGDLDIKNDFGISIEIFSTWQRAAILMWLGHAREAAEQYERCERLAHGRPEQEEFVPWIVGTWYGPPYEELTGIPTDALARSRRALQVAEVSGSSFMLVIARLYMGWAHLNHGDTAEALELMLSADEFLRERKIGVLKWNLGQGLLAEAYLAAGDRENARIVANRCVADRDVWVFELRAHLSRSRVLRALDGADARAEIESTLARADLLLEKSGARAFAPLIVEERARLFDVVGDRDGTMRALREAHRLFVDGGATGNALRLQRELES